MNTTEHFMTVLVVMATYIMCALIILNQLLRNKLDQERKDSMRKIEALVKKEKKIAKLSDQILAMQEGMIPQIYTIELTQKIQELEQKNIDDMIDYTNKIIESTKGHITLQNEINELRSKISNLPTSGENLTLLETKVNELKSEINTKNE